VGGNKATLGGPALRLLDDGADGRALGEHHLELLERAAHGLRVEEVHQRDDAGGDDGVDDEVAVADGVDGDRGDHDHDEVPQPVVGGGDGGHGDAEAHGRDFGAVQEVGAEEADGDEEVEGEDEERGSTHGGAVLVREARADGERHHAAGHSEAGEEEELAAAEAVDGEEGDEAGEELPGQAGAGQDAGDLGAHAQTVLEQDGGVDADEVAICLLVLGLMMRLGTNYHIPSAHLLEQLQEDAEGEAVEELVLAHGEDVLHAGRSVAGLFESELNAADFSGNHGVVLGQTTELGQVDTSLLTAALAAKPARRLGDQEDGRHEDDRNKDGEHQGDAPLDGEEVDLVEAQVDPRLEQVTQADEAAVQDGVGAAVLGSGALGLPDGDCCGELANTPSEDEASNDELCNVERGALEDLADEGQTGGQEDHLAATELVTEPGAGEGTQQGTDGEHGDDGALNGLLVGLLGTGGVDGVHFREGGGEVLEREQTANAGLVVTEEDEGRHDDQQQLGDLQLLSAEDHVERWEDPERIWRVLCCGSKTAIPIQRNARRGGD
jgi:hypothetical protein